MKTRRYIVFTREKRDVLLECPPHFRIANCPLDFPLPPAEIGHHPMFLDISYEERSGVRAVREFSYHLAEKPNFDEHVVVPVPDWSANLWIAYERSREVLALLNAISPEFFLAYGVRQSWFTSLTDLSRSAEYGQEGYNHAYETEVGPILPSEGYDLIDPVALEMMDQSTGDRTGIPTAQLFEIYLTAPDSDLKGLYLNACDVLSKAIGLMDSEISVSFLLMITAIEALVHIEHLDGEGKNCTTCGQPMYAVRRKFRDLLDKYCFEVPKKKKDEIYTLRSTLAHQGGLLPNEGSRKPYIEDQNDFDRAHASTIGSIEFQNMLKIAKTCFKAFLLMNRDRFLSQSLEADSPTPS